MRAIGEAFYRLRGEGKRALIPFMTAGDPDLPTTIRLVEAMDRAGCAIVELGVPFSDPVADGPVIQRASERALRHGHALADLLEAVRTARRASSIPIVLFSYFNPIYRYGLESFAADARAAGVDGILVTDMTPEESAEYRACLDRHGLDAVFLVAPTSSPERIARICECTRGFVYLVSRTGVTGVSDRLSEAVGPTIARVRGATDLPVAVGFGISRPEHVRAVWEIAEGAVVGSALVREIEAHGGSPDLADRVASLCRWLAGEAAPS